jgi:hypothetical protein
MGLSKHTVFAASIATAAIGDAERQRPTTAAAAAAAGPEGGSLALMCGLPGMLEHVVVPGDGNGLHSRGNGRVLSGQLGWLMPDNCAVHDYTSSNPFTRVHLRVRAKVSLCYSLIV